MGVLVQLAKRRWRAPLQDIRWFMLFYYITCCGVWGALSHNNAVTRVLEKRYGTFSINTLNTETWIKTLHKFEILEKA